MSAAGAPATAQHAADAIAAEPGCAVCHAAHGSASTALNLRLGDGVRVWGAEELGDVSRSCLRCHSTVAERARQPELADRGRAAGSPPVLLGPDLSAQHPMGRRTPLARMLEPGPPSRTSADPARLTAAIECSTCHDPHDRNGTAPRPEAETWLCGACHDGASLRAGHEALLCSDCHRMHGATLMGRLMAGSEPDATCRTCHLAPGPRSWSAPGPPGPRRPGAVAHRGDATPPAGYCTECHGIHR